ncbi:MAG: glycosyltransferase family 4 protein [Candidatus Dormibacteraeota bacterium]|nr:glycosyltransferase family 4 protein [Candidatus Dormibacteraeota bacterium]
MRLLILSAEPLDIARGSGTAMAIAQLRRALSTSGVDAPVIVWNRAAPLLSLGGARIGTRRLPNLDYDAILGIDGVGWSAADALGLPFLALIKALFLGAADHERGLTRGRLRHLARREGEGARRADAVVVPSQFAADSVRQGYAVDAGRLCVIPEPFDAVTWRAQLPQRQRGGNRVLCVAHLYPRKRIIDLVLAWPLVRASRPDARLDIVGDGPELRHLARVTAGLDGCYMHGHVDHPQLAEFYARADSFCLPSAQETFGYAVVEAMATGLPLAIADAGALPELCTTAVCETVPWGAPRALADALLRSLTAENRTRAANINPQQVAALAPSSVARQLIELVEQVRDARQRRESGSVSRSAASSR